MCSLLKLQIQSLWVLKANYMNRYLLVKSNRVKEFMKNARLKQPSAYIKRDKRANIGRKKS